MPTVNRAFVKLALLLSLGFVVASTGCGSLPRDPVPVDQMASAQVPGILVVQGGGAAVGLDVFIVTNWFEELRQRMGSN